MPKERYSCERCEEVHASAWISWYGNVCNTCEMILKRENRKRGKK